MVAEFAEIAIHLHCVTSEVEGAPDKNFLHKLVLQDHPDYDTIYARLEMDYYQTNLD